MLTCPSSDPNLPDHHTLDNCPSPYNNYLAYDGACYRAVNTPQTWQVREATTLMENGMENGRE